MAIPCTSACHKCARAYDLLLYLLIVPLPPSPSICRCHGILGPTFHIPADNFVVKATEAYERSAEIYHSYGSHHSSHHYLTTYGFVPNGFLQADYIAVLMPKGEPVSTRVTGNKKGRSVAFIGVDGHIYPEEFLKVYAFTLLRTVRPTASPSLSLSLVARVLVFGCCRSTECRIDNVGLVLVGGGLGQHDCGGGGQRVNR